MSSRRVLVLLAAGVLAGCSSSRSGSASGRAPVKAEPARSTALNRPYVASPGEYFDAMSAEQKARQAAEKAAAKPAGKQGASAPASPRAARPVARPAVASRSVPATGPAPRAHAPAAACDPCPGGVCRIPEACFDPCADPCGDPCADPCAGGRCTVPPAPSGN